MGRSTIGKRGILGLAVMALLVAACDAPADGGGAEEGGAEDAGAEAASLDCQAIEVIVPYSAGGGSDQQVRRLQPGLEEALGSNLNVSYQTGGDGSIGWNALAESEPDGCTIANVVAPNIMNLTLTTPEEDVGFTAGDFEYIAWTENSPNIIAVANDSEFETIEQFLEAARDDPGGVTISGVGAVGELLASEVVAATDVELQFVPVSGGVGDIVPQILGGHIDAAISGFSLLDSGQLRPLALSDETEAFPDVPTFEEAGYPGVTLVTSWGFILPPGTPQAIVEEWNAIVQEALQHEDVRSAYDATDLNVLEQDAEEARAYFEQQFEATESALEGGG